MTTITPEMLLARRAANDGNPLAATIYSAGGLAWRLLWDQGITPSSVSIDVDDDGDHWVTCVFDLTDGSGALVDAVAAAARHLDLPETTWHAHTYREWSGQVEDRYVALVAYLPDPPPTPWDRLRRRLPYKATGVALLAGSAAVGAVAALAARRVLR